MAVPRLAELLARARALVFDFDGTLVDSNPIKHRAFDTCFAEFPQQREEILAYCGGRHHTPRWEKFRHVCEQILRQPYTEERAASLHERFEAATTAQIIAAPEIPGAAAFLRRVQGGYTLALLSSTPHGILRDIVAQRNASGWFDIVQGAPVDKAAWLRSLGQERRWAGNQVVFFGDTEEDAAAAEAAGCAFVHVGDRGAPRSPWRIADFSGLLA